MQSNQNKVYYNRKLLICRMEVYDFFEDEFDECHAIQSYVGFVLIILSCSLDMPLLLALLFGRLFALSKRNVQVSVIRILNDS